MFASSVTPPLTPPVDAAVCAQTTSRFKTSLPKSNTIVFRQLSSTKVLLNISIMFWAFGILQSRIHFHAFPLSSHPNPVPASRRATCGAELPALWDGKAQAMAVLW